MKKVITTSVVFLLLLYFSGCSYLAVMFTKGKQISYHQSELSLEANKYFWENFHKGNYDSLETIINKLTQSYIENPSDLRTAAHLGFAHIWALAERQRIENLQPDIIDHIVLSQKYFSEAYTLNDNDPRILGFLADTKIIAGTIFDDPKLVVEGYFNGKKSISEWSQFNGFTIGYVMSNQDKNSDRYDEAIEWQWQTIEDCMCESIDRRNPDLKRTAMLVKASKDPMIYRACWNSWIAPHNWEGFFLNFGDMLVKKGDFRMALKMYEAVKLSDNFDEWYLKDVLQKRIENVYSNYMDFNKPVDDKKLIGKNVMMFNSEFSCMSCHRMGETEFTKYGYKPPGDEYYFLKK